MEASCAFSVAASCALGAQRNKRFVSLGFNVLSPATMIMLVIMVEYSLLETNVRSVGVLLALGCGLGPGSCGLCGCGLGAGFMSPDVSWGWRGKKRCRSVVRHLWSWQGSRGNVTNLHNLPKAFVKR
jgi:hypothetical protein